MTSNPVPRILNTLRTEQATSPALIWYGTDSERVELSGRVLDNWAAKTSNYLAEELDAEPGTTVELDLPAHWKTLVWALGAWQAGCPVALSAAAGSQVRATADHPEPRSAGEVVAAVALPALAMSWPGALPAGTRDYAAEVRSFADTWTGPVYDDEPSTALAAGTAAEVTAFSDLTGLDQDASRATTMLAPAEAGLARILGTALAVWSAGGTLVLTGAGVEATERMLAAEKVTARLGA
ncbi:TIGR03089 family protein [Arthrobacter gandavensis]|uniref:TIGR03089 family protein n=1 Tax=Arthrobacter gandavensis TaxID=169960 RepID=UPI00188E2FC5|nr:TIGR03089 family protein [Arthrobacter gandavensis]MBF4993053.1 TIGR03089 family protein [Arthrobacter gandavensis]